MSLFAQIAVLVVSIGLWRTGTATDVPTPAPSSISVTIMPSTDPRTKPGSTVFTRVRLITHESECRRQYGDTAWKTTYVPGCVVSCEIREKNGKNLKYLTVDWNLRSGTKRAVVYIAGVKETDPTLTPPGSDGDGDRDLDVPLQSHLHSARRDRLEAVQAVRQHVTQAHAVRLTNHTTPMEGHGIPRV